MNATRSSARRLRRRIRRGFSTHWPCSPAAYTQDGEAAYGFERAARVLQSVAATYRDDFNKYSHGRLKARIQLVFDRLPNMVGRKFKYVQVSREHRAAELADALQHLCMARVASKVHRSAANGVPLAAEASERHCARPAASPQKPPPITATWGREAPAIVRLLIDANFRFPEVCVGAVLVDDELAGASNLPHFLWRYAYYGEWPPNT